MTGRAPPVPADWLDKARREIRSARMLLDDDDPDGAVNRAYYAMFHAATAALASHGEICSTHAGVISRFSALFVQSGKIPKELGRAINLAEKARPEVDYSGGSLSR